jgi:hypothetical protein
MSYSRMPEMAKIHGDMQDEEADKTVVATSQSLVSENQRPPAKSK